MYERPFPSRRYAFLDTGFTLQAVSPTRVHCIQREQRMTHFRSTGRGHVPRGNQLQNRRYVAESANALSPSLSLYTQYGASSLSKRRLYTETRKTISPRDVTHRITCISISPCTPEKYRMSLIALLSKALLGSEEEGKTTRKENRALSAVRCHVAKFPKSGNVRGQNGSGMGSANEARGAS